MSCCMVTSRPSMATALILMKRSKKPLTPVVASGGCNAAATAARHSTIVTGNGIGGKAKCERKWNISSMSSNDCGATAKFVIADWLRTRLNASVSWPWQISIWYVENCCCLGRSVSNDRSGQPNEIKNESLNAND